MRRAVRFKSRNADLAGKALIYLREHGEANPRALARDLGTDSTTIGAVLTELEKRGHVRRRSIHAEHQTASRVLWSLP